MKSWEVPAKPFSAYTKKYKTGIVLGGVTDVHKLPRDRVFTKQGADRILHAAKLYDLGIIENILVSGGSFLEDEDAISEALQMKKILVQCGIPDSAIFVEGNSLNTRENAIESAEILKVKFPEETHLLITSAFHMKRAMGCFEKVDLNVDAFSTDFYTSDGSLNVNPLESIYPTEESLNITYRVSREVLGFIVYRVLGYT
ncbi:YdcF family protein [Chondrinema litorale]|uniref:YdcF family protein n=1 Tax=Chondrinema litorale TaxID=2994555 RepID=UPI002543D48E|nr:YdcF family protein [Chondrinema litorale]UZR95112.1 YdcF family protein [Chondrinema litorale]